MFSRITSLIFLGLIIVVGYETGYNIFRMVPKMREAAIKKVSEPWPSLKLDLKQTNDHDPFLAKDKKSRRSKKVH